MTNSSDITDQPINPYSVLGVTPSAVDEQIKQAFHAKLLQMGSSPLLVTAYSMIRDGAARRRYLWGQIESLFADPVLDMPAASEAPQVPVSELIRELAFLSEWELGDDTCLKQK